MAFQVVLGLGLASLVAALLRTVPLPHVAPFLPIAATIWVLADIMTAFLLLNRFYFSGLLGYAVLAVAYMFSGVIAIFYLSFFPGLFFTRAPDAPFMQTSAYCWFAWKCSFPIVVAFTSVYKRAIRTRAIERRWIGRVIVASVVAPVLWACGILAVVLALQDRLPDLVVAAHFLPLYANVVSPAVALISVASCALLVRRVKRLRVIDVWVAVALLSTAFEGVLNSISSGGYTLSWYAGKLEAVVTCSVVLGMLLFDLIGLYGRLSTAAAVDSLTGLSNRRVFEEHTATMLEAARRTGLPIAMLVIDVDYFKLFNDTYGHALGDSCLRRLARSMAADAARPFDLVARYGGEEFVVLLPDTPADGALTMARRLQGNIEALNIPHARYERGHVTVSIGVGVLTDPRPEDRRLLFELADRALYGAKSMGRNAISLGVQNPEQPERPARLAS